MQIGGPHEMGGACLHREPFLRRRTFNGRASLNMQIGGTHEMGGEGDTLETGIIAWHLTESQSEH